MSRFFHYLSKDGDLCGPVTEGELVDMAEAGEISLDTRIRISDGSGWIRFGEFHPARPPLPAGNKVTAESVPVPPTTAQGGFPLDRRANLSLGFPLVLSILGSLLFYLGILSPPPQQLSWAWRIDYGILSDDVVFMNTSPFALHDVTLEVRVVQDSKAWDRVLIAPVVVAGSEYRWSQVFSIPGSRVTDTKALLRSRENGVIGVNAYGQSLLDPIGFLDALNGLGIWAMIALIVLALYMISQLGGMSQWLRPKSNFLAFGIIALVSVFAVLLLQSISLLLLSAVGDMFGFAADHGATPSLIRNAAVWLAGFKSKAGILIVILFVLLFVMGGGYALVFAQTAGAAIPIWGFWLGMVLGVGLCEELIKTLLGVFFYRICFGDAEARTRARELIVCVGLSHLAFGTGEAIHYFGAYNTAGAGFDSFAIRVFWCVPLHCSWGIITGAVIAYASFLPDTGSKTSNTWDVQNIAGTILICAPAIFLHGTYNTFSDSLTGWAIGAVSLTIAYLVLRKTAEEHAWSCHIATAAVPP